ncbi:Pecanex-like protein [Trichinella pseudospiralis]
MNWFLEYFFYPVENVVRDVIEWRYTAASVFYVTILNALFWFVALCVEQEYQKFLLLLILALLAFDLVIFPILRYVILFIFWYFRRRKQSEQQILCRRSRISLYSTIIQPAFRLVFFLLAVKKGELTFVILVLNALKFLWENDAKTCCFLSYATLILSIIIPPWNYYKINWQILQFINRCCWLFYRWTWKYILQPCQQAVCFVASWCSYLFLFHWLKPLFGWLYYKFVFPIFYFCYYVFRMLWYCITGRWIRPLCRRILEFRFLARSFFYENLFLPIKKRIGQFVKLMIYILSLRWIVDLLSYTSHVVKSVCFRYCMGLAHLIQYYCGQLIATIVETFWRRPIGFVKRKAVAFNIMVKRKVLLASTVFRIITRRIFSIIFYGSALIILLTAKYSVVYVIEPVVKRFYELIVSIGQQLSDAYGDKIISFVETVREHGKHLSEEKDDEFRNFIPEPFGEEVEKMVLESSEEEEFLPNPDALNSMNQTTFDDTENGMILKISDCENTDSEKRESFCLIKVKLPYVDVVKRQIRLKVQREKGALRAGLSKLSFTVSGEEKDIQKNIFSDWEDEELSKFEPSFDDFEILDKDKDL